MRTTIPNRKFFFVIGLICVGLMTTAGALRLSQWRNDPHVFLLTADSDIPWIRAKQPFSLAPRFDMTPRETIFLCDFALPEDVADARIEVQAFRQFRLWLDAAPGITEPPLAESDIPERWKIRHVVHLRDGVSRGHHQLRIAVVNQAAPSCLRVVSPDLKVFTGPHWRIVGDDSLHDEAVELDAPAFEVLSDVQNDAFPPVATSFRKVLPVLLFLFALAFMLTWQSSERHVHPGSAKLPRLDASRLRWLLLAAWWIMAVNNFWVITPDLGFDVHGHLDYVLFLLRERRIPLASDGWQMFQSPLQYLLAAPLYDSVSRSLDYGTSLKVLRVFPLLCGMAQIEISYRAARLAFPGQDLCQMVATCVGGLMPMNLYMSQTFGNEPLAACLTAITLTMCLTLVGEPQRFRPWTFYVFLGAAWGLALLSKVTPVLLAPLIVGAVLFHGFAARRPCRETGVSLILTCGTSCLVSGWYYQRNCLLMGSFFVGGWDSARGIAWWQDPGYRTWAHLTSFGSSLEQPIHTGVTSFWDRMYASMWCDGHLSGTLLAGSNIPWNLDFHQVGAWMSLLPMACILLGIAFVGWDRRDTSRHCSTFAAAAVGIYVTAILDLYVRVPIYTAAKASYMLGLLPCFGILAGAGSRVFLKHRLIRSLFLAALTCWAFSAWTAFFCAE